MREDTDRMIERLSQEATPIRPLPSPFLRAAILLGGVGAAMAALAAVGGHTADVAALLRDPWFALELSGSLIAGISAIVAAVIFSVPGRSPSWLWLPAPGLALWMFGGGLGCYREIVESGYEPTSIFDSSACFTFILSAGLPAAIAIYLFLRRALSVEVVRVLTLGALGAALLAATLLQFVHAHPTNPIDFATHIVAVVLVMLTGVVAARVRA